EPASAAMLSRCCRRGNGITAEAGSCKPPSDFQIPIPDSRPMNDFIEVYEGALDATVCRELIEHFDASDKQARGETGAGVNTRLKDSWDICISAHAEWKNAENLLNTVMLRGLIAYIRKYPFLILAPVALGNPDPETGE